MDLAEFEKEAVQLLERTPKSRSRNCFRSAIRHLEKANALLGVDLEMAAFRALTAEEEAASGLMFCLKELRYPGAERLNPRQHQQKNAVIAFLRAVGRMPAELERDHQFEFLFEINNAVPEPKLGLAIKNQVLWPGLRMRPDPPLGFLATTGDKARSFAPYISEVADRHNEKDFLAHVERLANYRNKLLYASDAGLPLIKDIPASAVEQWKHYVFILLYSYLMIRPYKEHQLFVSQLLSSFLVALQKIPIGDLHPGS